MEKKKRNEVSGLLFGQIGGRDITFRSPGASVDFSTNKLKSGAGELALNVLDQLADAALINVGFKWEKMIPPPEEDDDVQVDEEDNDSADGEIEEEAETDFIDDDDDAIHVDLTAPSQLNNGVSYHAHFLNVQHSQDAPIQGILQSTTDSVAWKQEVERVAPLLKITIRQDAKDWRMHLEQMHSLHKAACDQINVIDPQLEQMASELEKTLERIETREKTMNSQMSSLLVKFRSSQDKRAELREKYKTASVGVSSRTETLQRISDDIEQLKQQIEEQGAKSSDGAPLLKIKQAVTKMEEEIQRMNVQIGVLEASIMSSFLRDRFAYNTDLYSYN
ncbi:unnamed protein product [Caenorhabditis auriculariae]|uniref:Uncharacterized protein n=1 Tax=Caenorhabditis auriculariae TaxID=2777116 RepID=A0A8S1H3T2_9PELO|nr:unnamed protein product [Caenorhabditis auriculariae]